MKEVNIKFEEEKAILYLAGHIDSKNAPLCEEEILKQLKKKEYGELVIDANELNYLSSAGLRVILKLKNNNKLTSIYNVNSEVYEIFDMTGFTEMIDIVKKYREVSIDGAIVIGEGANGIVYKIDDETIVKVYKNNDAIFEIKRERELCKKAFVLGIPTAISYDIVKVGDKFGTVFELLNADSFSRLIINNPDKIDTYILEMTNILKTIHSIHAKDGEFYDIKSDYLNQLEMIKNDVDSSTYNKLKGMLTSVKDTGTLIHGDYHTKNIMLQNGEPILIDMDTLAIGNPVFEFATMFLSYQGFSLMNHDNIKNFLGFSFEEGAYIFDNILKDYFIGKSEEEVKVIKDKITIISYMRLLRRTLYKVKERTENELGLIKISKERLIELVKKYDDLNIID